MGYLLPLQYIRINPLTTKSVKSGSQLRFLNSLKKMKLNLLSPNQTNQY